LWLQRRVGEIIDRIRGLIKRAPSRNDRLDINETILEVIALTRSEVQRNGVSLQTRLADGLPLVQGDRIQLQQVILNLIVNAVEAMSGARDGARELLISTGKDASNAVLVAVRDSGSGLDPKGLDRLFDAFYTTKSSGKVGVRREAGGTMIDTPQRRFILSYIDNAFIGSFNGRVRQVRVSNECERAACNYACDPVPNSFHVRVVGVLSK
jgi:light-regulated signal transduction histidine kinase (bacteriophytochrome)